MENGRIQNVVNLFDKRTNEDPFKIYLEMIRYRKRNACMDNTENAFKFLFILLKSIKKLQFL